MESFRFFFYKKIKNHIIIQNKKTIYIAMGWKNSTCKKFYFENYPTISKYLRNRLIIDEIQHSAFLKSSLVKSVRHNF
jgi:hypothetical protein